MLIARILGLAIAAIVMAPPLAPAQAQSHVALVIGNGAYAGGQLPTPGNDAAAVAETMRAAGYDVTEANDVREADIGTVMRAFLDKVTAAGPDAVAFFYYSGQAAQAGSENYLVPVDAQIGGIDDVPAHSLRLNELVDALAALPAVARIVVLDASRDHGFGRGTAGAVPPGLAIMEAPAGTLIAFAAAPGQISLEAGTQYSLYTATLATLMRQPGLDLDQIFKTARVQVNQVTGGKQMPWTAMGLTVQVTLFPGQPAVVPPPPPIAPAVNNAPPPATIPPKGERTVTKGMLSQLSPDDAYTVAIEEDSLEVFQWFVELFPKYQYAGQIWDVITARRDELLWQRAVAVNTRNGYWNYLDRFPNGVHAAEAQQALASLDAPRQPPQNYVPQPVQLPPDYYDEALDLGEIVPYGDPPPPSVFDILAPMFLPPPPPPPPFFFPPRPPRIVLVTPPPVVVKPPPVVIPPKNVSVPTTPTKHTGVRLPNSPPPPPTHGPKVIGAKQPVNKVPVIPPPTHGPTPPTIPPGPGPHGPTPPTIPPGPGPHGPTPPTIPPGPGPHGPTPPTIPPSPGPHGPTPPIPPVPGPHGPTPPVTPPTIPPVPGPHGGPTPPVTPPTIPPVPKPPGPGVVPPSPVSPTPPPPHPVMPPPPPPPNTGPRPPGPGVLPPPPVVHPPAPPLPVVHPPAPPPPVVHPPAPPPVVKPPPRPPSPPPPVVHQPPPRPPAPPVVHAPPPRPPSPPPPVFHAPPPRPPAPPPPRAPTCSMVGGKQVCR